MNRQILGGSHSSVEPMDDLMEMDFSPSVPSSSKSNRNKNTGKSTGRSKSTCVNEYVSMSPADRLSVPGIKLWRVTVTCVYCNCVYIYFVS